MTDNKQNRGVADRTRINVNEEHELRYWTETLGVSRDELIRAVREVGVMASDVRAKLRHPS
jgi:hypothetical protein